MAHSFPTSCPNGHCPVHAPHCVLHLVQLSVHPLLLGANLWGPMGTTRAVSSPSPTRTRAACPPRNITEPLETEQPLPRWRSEAGARGPGAGSDQRGLCAQPPGGGGGRKCFASLFCKAKFASRAAV